MGINATIIGQTITFAVFVLFTMKFVWPPIKQAMNERAKKIEDGLAAAERGEASLAEASQASDDALKDARTQAQDILAGDNRQANDIVEKAKTEARTEADRIIAAANEEIDASMQRAKAELRKEVSAIALAGAQKVLAREVDASAHDDLLKQLATEI